MNDLHIMQFTKQKQDKIIYLIIRLPPFQFIIYAYIYIYIRDNISCLSQLILFNVNINSQPIVSENDLNALNVYVLSVIHDYFS